jgi:tetratricopeptide (TPR) repeat protein
MEVVKESLERATELWQQGYQAQKQGEVGTAMRLYQESLATHPTAEAHTFLGWAYSFLGRYEQAC